MRATMNFGAANPIRARTFVGMKSVLPLFVLPSMALGFSANVGDAFSLPAYQKACALETSQSLDASRLHFQILFVDDDNAKGRMAEGLLDRIAEYNDAMFVLFPFSATIEGSRNAPLDAAPSEFALRACASLGLCSTRSTMMGTSFDLSYLDEYDLVICFDEEVRSLIFRSLNSEDQEYYAPRCRLLSEFLSPEFCSANSVDVLASNKNVDNNLLLDMLDPELKERVAPLADQVIGCSSNIFQAPDWPVVETALILASAGLTRFSLDTIDVQFEAAFQILLEKNFYRPEHLQLDLDFADDQLRKCSSSVTGYFSEKQRLTRLKKHMTELRTQFGTSTGGGANKDGV